MSTCVKNLSDFCSLLLACSLISVQQGVLMLDFGEYREQTIAVWTDQSKELALLLNEYIYAIKSQLERKKEEEPSPYTSPINLSNLSHSCSITTRSNLPPPQTISKLPSLPALQSLPSRGHSSSSPDFISARPTLVKDLLGTVSKSEIITTTDKLEVPPRPPRHDTNPLQRYAPTATFPSPWQSHRPQPGVNLQPTVAEPTTSSRLNPVLPSTNRPHQDDLSPSQPVQQSTHHLPTPAKKPPPVPPKLQRPMPPARPGIPQTSAMQLKTPIHPPRPTRC